MIVTPVANPSNARKETPAMVNKSPAAGPPNGDHIPPTNHGGAAVLSHTAASLSGSQNPNILYHHIQEMANKRIATLDYFRKAYVCPFSLSEYKIPLLAANCLAGMKTVSFGSTPFISPAQIYPNSQSSPPQSSLAEQKTISF